MIEIVLCGDKMLDIKLNMLKLMIYGKLPNHGDFGRLVRWNSPFRDFRHSDIPFSRYIR